MRKKIAGCFQVPIMLISLLLLTSSLSVNGQGKAAVLRDSGSHILDFFIRDSVAWVAANPGYRPANETSPSYFSYLFSRGLHSNSVNFILSGYLPGMAGWKKLQQGLLHWDPARNVMGMVTTDTGGLLMTGESVLIHADSMSILQSIAGPGSKKESQKLLFKFDKNQFQTIQYQRSNKNRVSTSLLSWKKMEQPMGQISFMSTRDGNWEIYSMTANGEIIKNLSCHKATDYMFAFIPKTDQFVYYTNRDGNDEIYLMSADGKKQTNLTNHPAADRIATVSPDGKQIIFLSNRDHVEGEIYLMDTSGHAVRRLTNNEFFEDLPVFSPDGTHIIYSRTVHEPPDSAGKSVYNAELFIMDSNGKNERRLTNRPGGDGGAQISPDGNWIVFHGKSGEGYYDLFLMDLEGNRLRNLTNDQLEDYSPSWSPDGKWLAYTKGNSKNYDVWIMEISTGIQTRLTMHPKRDESPVWKK